MKPLNTFASEVLRKVSKSDSYKNLNADQVLLSITKDPILWYNVPIIYLKRGNDSLRKIIGRNNKEKYAAFTDFFDEKGILSGVAYAIDKKTFYSKNGDFIARISILLSVLLLLISFSRVKE